MHTPHGEGREPCRDVQASCCLCMETVMNQAEHGVRLLDFVCQVLSKREVVLESNIQIFFRCNLVEVHPDFP